MKVPFLDLKWTYRSIQNEIDNAITGVLESGWYVLDTELDAFEQAFANYCNADFCIGVGSGLDALRLSLVASDVGPGDEVIVPSNTYIATWLAVSHCGATPVPVEPDIFSHNIDPNRIECAITSRTRAILPVHLYGAPAALEPIVEVANRHGLLVIEDGAQTHGAKYQGNRIGAHGNAVAWSFYPSKNLGAFGDGGAITTNDAKLADRVRILRNYGSRIKYQNETLGFNSRLDSLQAAVLGVKLAHLNDWNKRRRQLALKYLNELTDTPLVLPIVPEATDPAWHLFVVRHERRDWLQKKLKEKGIDTLIHYPIPPHLQEAYHGLANPQAGLPVAERLAKEVLSLPMGPHITAEQQAYVVHVLRHLLL